MRGRTVVFQTAVAVVCARERLRTQPALVPVTVRFRELSDAEIERYLRAEQPYDCAGSAKSEGLGIALLEAIDSRRPDGADRPAADPHLRAAARAPASIRSARRAAVPTHDLAGHALPGAERARFRHRRRRRRSQRACCRSARCAIAARLGHWVCREREDDARLPEARRCRRPLARPLQADRDRRIAARRPRGATGAGRVRRSIALLAPALGGQRSRPDLGGGAARGRRPGRAARRRGARAGLRVVAAAGRRARSLLALAASGLNGQSFAFVGYLPIEAGRARARIRELEALSRRPAQTQVMIETPYRNAALLGALLAHLQPATMLSVSVGLTLAGESTRSDSVARWRAGPSALAGGRAGGVLAPGALSATRQDSAVSGPCRRTGRRPSSSA